MSQMALLAAMKFHSAAVSLPQPPPRHWPSILAAIRHGITYLQQLVRSRVAAAYARSCPQEVYEVQQWLDMTSTLASCANGSFEQNRH